ncbi:hypothetical protein WDJ51_03735, partial [Rathayibacter sp. YIM 133350]|uniref:hypothetical protein n=1 Tax=Rathayibacter sp. YIM 133350 TaxID=3131992 RepID=UPI00307ED51E
TDHDSSSFVEKEASTKPSAVHSAWIHANEPAHHWMRVHMKQIETEEERNIRCALDRMVRIDEQVGEQWQSDVGCWIKVDIHKFTLEAERRVREAQVERLNEQTEFGDGRVLRRRSPLSGDSRAAPPPSQQVGIRRAVAQHRRTL